MNVEDEQGGGIKQITLEEFRVTFHRSGESVIGLADIAARCISNDDELVNAAQCLIDAEDRFEAMLDERNIIR